MVDSSHIEDLIRSGKISEAWSSIKNVRPSDLKRSELLVFADFGRRVQQPMYSLKTLAKVLKSHRDQLDIAVSSNICCARK